MSLPNPYPRQPRIFFNVEVTYDMEDRIIKFILCRRTRLYDKKNANASLQRLEDWIVFLFGTSSSEHQ